MGTISTDAIALEYEDRWLLTGFRVFAPCGDGSDLVDRVKGRAAPLVGNQEDEENWNENSSYLGGIVGPVRAIRYVRGATSAVNTIHHDVVYRGFWKRQVNLRVHPLLWATLYVDWRPQPAARFFTPLLRSGVPVDGVPDSVADTFVEWVLFAGARGGAIFLHEFPSSPLYDRRTLFYRDDASFDDEVPTNPAYGDDDDASYGAVGIRLEGIKESNTLVIPMGFQIWPLCAGVGDAMIGDAYDEVRDIPLSVQVAEEAQPVAVIRSLLVGRQGQETLLTWDPAVGASVYRIYASPVPSADHAGWTLLAETPATTFVDTGAAAAPQRYYSVVANGPTGEGPW